MLGPRIKENWKGSNRRGNSECQHLRNQRTKNGLERVNLTQRTIISTMVGKNPLEEMELPS